MEPYIQPQLNVSGRERSIHPRRACNSSKKDEGRLRLNS